MKERLHYLWHDAGTEGIEVLSAILSATFAVLLLGQGERANAIDHAYPFAALCLVASTCKLVGVTTERLVLRVVGLLIGTVFWVMIAGSFLATVHGSITWLCFGVLAGAQLWCVWRLMARRWN